MGTPPTYGQAGRDPPLGADDRACSHGGPWKWEVATVLVFVGTVLFVWDGVVRFLVLREGGVCGTGAVGEDWEVGFDVE